jgi:hypothetical protein
MNCEDCEATTDGYCWKHRVTVYEIYPFYDTDGEIVIKEIRKESISL